MLVSTSAALRQVGGSRRAEEGSLVDSLLGCERSKGTLQGTGESY